MCQITITICLSTQEDIFRVIDRQMEEVPDSATKGHHFCINLKGQGG